MYLFFIREFNDIDHITPIVWKMASDGEAVAVYCLNPSYDLDRDYRLAFLRNLGIKVCHVFDECIHTLALRHRALRFASRCCYNVSNCLNGSSRGLTAFISTRLQHCAARLGKKCFKRIKRFYDERSWAHALLLQTRAQALCFDHVNPGRHVVSVLLSAAHRLSIPTFALPHGVFIYTNQHVRTGTTQESRFDKFNRFEFIVTQNNLRKNVLARAGVNPDKIYVLGSARYSDEWMAQNSRILPRKLKPSDSNASGLKAVFMTTRFAYKIDVDRMRTTIDLLSAIDDLHLVIKPHTRSGQEAKFYDRLAASNVSDLSSVELCDWADIVFVIGSSILIEPLKSHKPVLYLKYLHDNTTQYEEMGACWTINNEDELMKAVAVLREDQLNVPYNATSVNRFLAEIIYGGREPSDVLNIYKSFRLCQEIRDQMIYSNASQ